MKYIIQKFTLTLENNTEETDPLFSSLPPSLLTARQFLMQLAKQWAGLQVIMQSCVSPSDSAADLIPLASGYTSLAFMSISIRSSSPDRPL